MAIPYSSSWDFRTDHVQPDTATALNDTGNFISAESLLLCALPTGSTDIGASLPIGLLQNMGVQQQKQINQIYEIGSKLSYIIPGKTLIQVQLNRVMFDGDSLMAALYTASDTYGTGPAGTTAERLPGFTVPITGGEPADKQFYLNLAADFFNSPTDLCIIMHDTNAEPVGAIILKECHIQAHGLGISANQTIVAENVSLRCQKILSFQVT